jgi:exosortase/archaeosortase family protein
MNLRRSLGLVLAVAVAAGIWLRDPGWRTVAADTLPALAAFPLVAWLGRPWSWRSGEIRPPVGALLAGAGLILTGSMLGVTAVLAAGWCVGVGGWLRRELERGGEAMPIRWLVVLFCGFPWVALDGQAVGWWFRFSGAAVAEGFFSGLGFAVAREGTLLRVQGLPLAVDAACSGLNVLQAMLLAGTALAALLLQGRRYWAGLALLLPLAWLANTARIIALGLIGLSFGAEVARGWFHTWGGWSLLCLMFLLCLGIFHLLATRRERLP